MVHGCEIGLYIENFNTNFENSSLILSLLTISTLCIFSWIDLKVSLSGAKPWELIKRHNLIILKGSSENDMFGSAGVFNNPSDKSFKSCRTIILLSASNFFQNVFSLTSIIWPPGLLRPK